MATKSIIIAVDNSKECFKAVDFVLEHFPKGYEYHLLHVQVSSIASELITDDDDVGLKHERPYKMDKELTAASEDFLKEYFLPKAQANGAEVTSTLLHSFPDGSTSIGSAICEFAEKTRPAALVLMKQQKSALKRFFLGSVTKFCVVHSHVPVIVVPA
ncbi:hypothetical protein WJX75_008784 [Coccomyxa subellipsoidea]|uniref:UspA domain-containing protein n=1 Tax=Coccomyxa subellipsoidea TaxID=248742 RepID=A0ABR2YXR6_9CHLO